VFVVNKADKPGAQETVRDLRSMIAMARRHADDWKPPIVTTVAIKGEGIGELVAKVDAHWAWLDSSGQGEARRRARAREEIAAIALAELRTGRRRPARRLPAGRPGRPGRRGQAGPLHRRRRTDRHGPGVKQDRRGRRVTEAA